MKREELDRLEELRRKICGGGPVNGAAIAAWDDAIFAAAPAILAAAREADELRTALAELHALVCGECPSLLDEDSGGDMLLDMKIDELLARVKP